MPSVEAWARCDDGEGVVDVIIAERRHALGQLRVVLLLADVEAGVLEDADRSRQHDRDRPRRFRALAILDEADRPAGQLGQRLDQQRGRHVGPALPLGPAEMRQQQHDRALVAQFGDGRHRGAQPRVVADRAVLHRHVQIDAHQHPLAGQVVRQVVEGFEAGRHRLRSSLAIAPAVSTMRFEKPHSLSYQLTTRTSLPSITAVSRLSTVELAGLWLRSIETSGSSV